MILSGDIKMSRMYGSHVKDLPEISLFPTGSRASSEYDWLLMTLRLVP